MRGPPFSQPFGVAVRSRRRSRRPRRWLHRTCRVSRPTPRSCAARVAAPGPHLHMLFLDGAYTFRGTKASFHRARRLQPDALAKLLASLSRRIVRLLERRGLLIADPQHPVLEFDVGSALDQIQAASVKYCIAVGPHAGRKALTLYRVPPVDDSTGCGLLAQVAGFSPHAARRLAFVGAVTGQRATAMRMIGTTRKPCIAPRLGPNVLLAGVPRLKPKLHRPRPGGVLSRAGHSSKAQGTERLSAWRTTGKVDGEAVDLWTSPCGPARALRTVWAGRGQRGDALPTACPHSRASRPQLHRFDNEIDASRRKNRSHGDFRIRPSSQTIQQWINPRKRPGVSNELMRETTPPPR